jgi:hypothetical protein
MAKADGGRRRGSDDIASRIVFSRRGSTAPIRFDGKSAEVNEVDLGGGSPTRSSYSRNTHGVQVSALRQRRSRAELFGRHINERVGGRLLRGIVCRNSDGEVGDTHRAVLIDEDARRAQVAVQHPSRVRGRQS